MFQIDDTLISEEIISEEFVCNISKCKGQCCVSGSAGAPLEKEETKILEKLYSKISPFLSKKGRKAIKEQGNYVRGFDGDLETPLIENKECAYTVFDKSGVAQCGIEKAYNQGAIKWNKPISCHLYPIRVNKYPTFTAVNYHEWSVCDSACSLGAELKVPVYKFVKNALVRKFGKKWFKKLSLFAKDWKNKKIQ
mgnify:FL=1|tara:strand:- start:996 stop:1577 length:582 start_codon:yes stop_codon:yes gene_type:complete